MNSEGPGFCCAKDEPDFAITTDSNGVAEQTWQQCMIFGTEPRGTWGMHLPPWWFTASAPGYIPSQEAVIESYRYHDDLIRGDRIVTLPIVIRLQPDHIE